MPYLLIPHEVSTTEATIWIGEFGENIKQGQPTLEYDGKQLALTSPWQQWASQDGRCRLGYQHVTLHNLAIRKSYSVTLLDHDVVKAQGTVTTLPDRVPAQDEKPFTVLLGSCFCEGQDQSGTVGNTYFHLPFQERPEIKILCGDQVYLDSPWHYYTTHTHTRAQLEQRFVAAYWRTWSQSGAAAGFYELLRSGANYFSPDDHELWNNAPNGAAFIRDTWSGAGRANWYDAARSLYNVFQSTTPISTFAVGTLSFLIADTRMNRATDRTKFMRDQDLAAVSDWVNALNGPGLLVVGQPLLSDRAGIMGHFQDWVLPNYDQYADLVRILARANHSIVILTGDVHFGRIASVVFAGGNELVEVISSPMSLVDQKAGGTWEKAPDYFPAFNIPQAARVPVGTETQHAPAYNHFVTLEFCSIGARVKMRVKLWPITRSGILPHSVTVGDKFLQ